MVTRLAVARLSARYSFNVFNEYTGYICNQCRLASTQTRGHTKDDQQEALGSYRATNIRKHKVQNDQQKTPWSKKANTTRKFNPVPRKPYPSDRDKNERREDFQRGYRRLRHDLRDRNEPLRLTEYQAYRTSPQFNNLDSRDVMIKLFREVRAARTAFGLDFQAGKEDEPRLKELFSIISLATDDYVQKKIPTHNVASRFLLSIYEQTRDYEAGIRVWDWLVKQSDDCLDAKCYAVAIILLEQSGENNLAQLEELYQEALQRYPGSFVEYHFSPTAILPDRDNPVPIPGLPLNLLRTIAEARLRAGANHEAYTALDTLLRLDPTLAPAQTASLAHHSSHPGSAAVAEAWMLFMLAHSISPDSRPIASNKLRTMLLKLGGIAQLMIGGRIVPPIRVERRDILDSVVAFNRMAECMRVFGKTDDQRNASNLLLLLSCLGRCALSPNSLSGSLSNDVRSSYNKGLFVQGQRLLFMTASCSPATFEGIITQMIILAGQAEDAESVKTMRDQLLTRTGSNDAGVTMAQHARALSSLGLLTTDSAPLKDAWALAKSTAQSANITMPVDNWECLAETVRVQRRSDDLKWFEDELTANQDIDPTKKQDLLTLVNTPIAPPNKYEDQSSFAPIFLDNMVKSITKAIDRLEEPFGHVGRLRYGFYDLPDVREDYTKTKRTLLHSVPDEILRRVYDEMTTDPAQISQVMEAAMEDDATEPEAAEAPITAAEDKSQQTSDATTIEGTAIEGTTTEDTTIEGEEMQEYQPHASDTSIADLRFYNWSAMNHLFAYNKEVSLFTTWAQDTGKLEKGFDWKRRKVSHVFRKWQGARRFQAHAEWARLMRKKGDEGERLRVEYVKRLIVGLRGLDGEEGEGKELLF